MNLSNIVGRTAINLGIDPRRLKDVSKLKRYLRDRSEWIRKGGKIDEVFPILGDYEDQAGSARGHYFHMDLLVASFIADSSPQRHVDIGSRVDGFIAHVAAFRPIEVIDIRPLSIPAHPRIRFLQADLMQPASGIISLTDSLSCLHVLEHFGLGRYGDPIDPMGHLTAFSNMVDIIAPSGTFYFATPVGKPRVYFNAHRVFDPVVIPEWQRDKLRLARVRTH